MRLDNYDPDDIDDQDFEQMDPAERARVEAILARRDAERARAAGRIPEAFMDGMKHHVVWFENIWNEHPFFQLASEAAQSLLIRVLTTSLYPQTRPIF